MVRDLMVTRVERRFGGTKAAHPVEWLSDNGSAYTAKDTQDLLLGWIDDYNISHPHGGLRMLWPREYRARCA